jgi:hypothetical protein
MGHELAIEYALLRRGTFYIYKESLAQARVNVEKRGSVSIDSSGTLVLHHVHTARVVVAAEVNKTGSTEAFVGLPAAFFMCDTTFCTLNTLG